MLVASLPAENFPGNEKKKESKKTQADKNLKGR